MDAIERLLHAIGLFTHRVLWVPVREVEELNSEVLRQFGQVGLRGVWAGWALTAVWVVLAVLVLRILAGWWRALAILLGVLFLADFYGLLPWA